MPIMYNPEDLKNFLKEEQGKAAPKGSEQDKEELKKIRNMASKAATTAQIAFEQAQKLKFELDETRGQLKKTRIIAIIAIVIAIVCMAMTMGGELSALMANLPS